MTIFDGAKVGDKFAAGALFPNLPDTEIQLEVKTILANRMGIQASAYLAGVWIADVHLTKHEGELKCRKV